MDMEFVLKMVGILEVWTSYKMKRLLFVPLLFLINLPILGKNIDSRILCMRNRIKFDDWIEKGLIDKRYSLNIWAPARQRAEEKAGNEFNSNGPFEEPYKSIHNKWENLTKISSRAAYEEDLSSIPILELLGFENGDWYLAIKNTGYKELSELYGVTNFKDIEDWNIAQDYFGYKSKAKVARNDFCKLYGIEFDYRDEEPYFGDFKF